MFKLALIAFFTVAFCCALLSGETDCQSHQRNSRNSNHTLQWDIRCDEEGNYLPLQCTNDIRESKRWCACYNSERAITRALRETRTCVCPLVRDAAQNEGLSECSIPTCAPDDTGKFEKKQCCADTCHCVDPNTGHKESEPTTTDWDRPCP